LAPKLQANQQKGSQGSQNHLSIKSILH
jgi:hypothetical protein